MSHGLEAEEALPDRDAVYWALRCTLVSRREKLKARSVVHATHVLQNANAAPVGLVLAS